MYIYIYHKYLDIQIHKKNMYRNIDHVYSYMDRYSHRYSY